MQIYQLVLFKNAQAIQDLDRYQMRRYNCHIRKLEEPGPPELKVPIHTELEEIEREMRIARSRE